MRKSGIIAPCAALVLVMLGGCRFAGASSNTLVPGSLVATLLRSSSGSSVGKATVGSIAIDTRTTTYYLEIEVCYHGQNEVTSTIGTPSLHAVHFVYGAPTSYPVQFSIPLDFQPISGLLGHNFGYVKIPINVDQYNAIQEYDVIKISKTNVASGPDLIDGSF